LQLDDLDAIVVGVGPGSFTGVRVAVSYAQAMALVKKIPVFTLPSLLFYLPESDGNFYSILDARRGDVYYIAGVRKENQVEYTIPQVGPFADLDINHQFVSPDFEDLNKKLHVQIQAPSSSSLHVLAGCVGQQSASLPLEIMYLRSPQGAS
jgi:tRNA threonylcarbamoyl adenosine modification protein YeaZ